MATDGKTHILDYQAKNVILDRYGYRFLERIDVSLDLLARLVTNDVISNIKSRNIQAIVKPDEKASELLAHLRQGSVNKFHTFCSVLCNEVDMEDVVADIFQLDVTQYKIQTEAQTVTVLAKTDVVQSRYIQPDLTDQSDEEPKPIWHADNPDQQNYIERDKKCRTSLQGHWKDLKQHVQTKNLWKHLRDLDVIDASLEMRFRSLESRSERVECVLNLLMQSPRWKFHAFLRALYLSDQQDIIRTTLNMDINEYATKVPEDKSQPDTVMNQKRMKTSTREKHQLFRKGPSQVQSLSDDLIKGILHHCEASLKNLMRHNLLGLDDHPETEIIDVSKCLIEVDVEFENRKSIQTDLNDSVQESSRNALEISLEEILYRSGKVSDWSTVRVHGSPGVGKSTWMTYIVYRWCKDFIKNRNTCMWTLMLYIQARDIKKNIMDTIHHSLCCHEKEEGIMMKHIQEGEHICIMLDSFDEIKNEALMQEIVTFVQDVKKRGRLTVFVSTRKNLCYLMSRDFSEKLVLPGFSIDQGIQYVIGYCQREEAKNGALKQDVAKYVITNKMKMQHLLANPLHLHMFTVLACKAQIPLTENVAFTLSVVLQEVEKFLICREKERQQANTLKTIRPRIEFPTEESKAFKQLCLHGLLNNQTSFSKKDIRVFNISAAYKNTFLNETTAGPESEVMYNFSHEVLYEFFGSSYIKELSITEVKQILLPICSKVQLRNVQKIVIDLIKETKKATQLIQSVVQAICILQFKTDVRPTRQQPDMLDRIKKGFLGVLQQNKPSKESILEHLLELSKSVITLPMLAGHQSTLWNQKAWQRIEEAFNIHATLLKEEGWFQNLVKSGTIEHVLDCIQILPVSLQQHIFQETMAKILPCTWGKKVKHVAVPTSDGRFAIIEKKEGETTISVLYPSDVVPALKQFCDISMEKLDPAIVLNPVPGGSSWWANSELLVDKWQKVIVSLLQAGCKISQITIQTPRDQEVQLEGLLKALQQLVRVDHGLTAGMVIIRGKASAKNLMEAYEWSSKVGLKLFLYGTTVSLGEGQTLDDVVTVHRDIMHNMHAEVAELQIQKYVTKDGNDTLNPDWRVRYGFRSGNIGKDFIVPTHTGRWAMMRKHEEEMVIFAWSPQDIMSVLATYKLMKSSNEILHTAVLRIDHKVIQQEFGICPNEQLTKQEWRPILQELLLSKHEITKVIVQTPRNVPLHGFLQAAWASITPGHILTGGMCIEFGQISVNVLKKTLDWCYRVNLKFVLDDVTVVIAKEQKIEDVPSVHMDIVKHIQDDSVELKIRSYITDDGMKLQKSNKELPFGVWYTANKERTHILPTELGRWALLQHHPDMTVIAAWSPEDIHATMQVNQQIPAERNKPLRQVLIEFNFDNLVADMGKSPVSMLTEINWKLALEELHKPTSMTSLTIQTPLDKDMPVDGLLLAAQNIIKSGQRFKSGLEVVSGIASEEVIKNALVWFAKLKISLVINEVSVILSPSKSIVNVPEVHTEIMGQVDSDATEVKIKQYITSDETDTFESHPGVSFGLKHTQLGKEYTMPTTTLRWAQMRNQAQETWLFVWCPEDLMYLLIQWSLGLPSGSYPQLVVIKLGTLPQVEDFGPCSQRELTKEKWVPVFKQFLKYKMRKIEVRTNRNIPLDGLLQAAQEEITFGHDLVGGLGVVNGKVSEAVLLCTLDWANAIKLSLVIIDTTVVMSAGHQLQDVTSVHGDIMAKVSDSIEQFTICKYITAEEDNAVNADNGHSFGQKLDGGNCWPIVTPEGKLAYIEKYAQSTVLTGYCPADILTALNVHTKPMSVLNEVIIKFIQQDEAILTDSIKFTKESWSSLLQGFLLAEHHVSRLTVKLPEDADFSIDEFLEASKTTLTSRNIEIGGGIKVEYGKASEEVLRRVLEWADKYQFPLGLYNISVVLSEDMDLDLSSLHQVITKHRAAQLGDVWMNRFIRSDGSLVGDGLPRSSYFGDYPHLMLKTEVGRWAGIHNSTSTSITHLLVWSPEDVLSVVQKYTDTFKDPTQVPAFGHVIINLADERLQLIYGLISKGKMSTDEWRCVFDKLLQSTYKVSQIQIQTPVVTDLPLDGLLEAAEKAIAKGHNDMHGFIIGPGKVSEDVLRRSLVWSKATGKKLEVNNINIQLGIDEIKKVPMIHKEILQLATANVLCLTIRGYTMLSGTQLAAEEDGAFGIRPNGSVACLLNVGESWGNITRDKTSTKLVVWRPSDVLDFLTEYKRLYDLDHLALRDLTVEIHWVMCSAEQMTREVWRPVLDELIKAEYELTGLRVKVLESSDAPLDGFLEALLDAIQPGHGLASGVQLGEGQMSDAVVTRALEWSRKVELNLRLYE